MSECKSDEVLIAEIDRLKKQSKMARIPRVYIAMVKAIVGSTIVSGLASGVIGGAMFFLESVRWLNFTAATFLVLLLATFLVGMFHHVEVETKEES